MAETADRVFEYIVQYKRAHDGNSPGLRDIVRACGLSSVSIAHYHLRKLAGEGMIRITDYGIRQIEVVGGVWTLDEVQREGRDGKEESL